MRRGGEGRRQGEEGRKRGEEARGGGKERRRGKESRGRKRGEVGEGRSCSEVNQLFGVLVPVDPLWGASWCRWHTAC